RWRQAGLANVLDDHLPAPAQHVHRRAGPELHRGLPGVRRVHQHPWWRWLYRQHQSRPPTARLPVPDRDRATGLRPGIGRSHHPGRDHHWRHHRPGPALRLRPPRLIGGFAVASTREINDPTYGRLVRPNRTSTRVGPIISLALRYAVLIVLALTFLFPFYLIVRNALMTQAEITGFDWVWWPETPQWSNFTDLFDDTSINMASGLRASAIIAVVNLVLQTLFASMAGYALARI